MNKYVTCASCNTTIELDHDDGWKVCSDCNQISCRSCRHGECHVCRTSFAFEIKTGYARVRARAH